MSDDVEVYTQEFPIEDSLCFTCKHRLSRVLVPIDPEAMGIDLDEVDLDEEENLVVEQHTCTAIMQDMDYIVSACSKFEDTRKEPNALFRHDM